MYPIDASVYRTLVLDQFSLLRDTDRPTNSHPLMYNIPNIFLIFLTLSFPSTEISIQPFRLGFFYWYIPISRLLLDLPIFFHSNSLARQLSSADQISAGKWCQCDTVFWCPVDVKYWSVKVSYAHLTKYKMCFGKSLTKLWCQCLQCRNRTLIRLQEKIWRKVTFTSDIKLLFHFNFNMTSK